jgi:hypothetical protein
MQKSTVVSIPKESLRLLINAVKEVEAEFERTKRKIEGLRMKGNALRSEADDLRAKREAAENALYVSEEEFLLGQVNQETLNLARHNLTATLDAEANTARLIDKATEIQNKISGAEIKQLIKRRNVTRSQLWKATAESLHLPENILDLVYTIFAANVLGGSENFDAIRRTLFPAPPAEKILEMTRLLAAQLLDNNPQKEA